MISRIVVHPIFADDTATSFTSAHASLHLPHKQDVLTIPKVGYQCDLKEKLTVDDCKLITATFNTNGRNYEICGGDPNNVLGRPMEDSLLSIEFVKISSYPKDFEMRFTISNINAKTNKTKFGQLITKIVVLPLIIKDINESEDSDDEDKETYKQHTARLAAKKKTYDDAKASSILILPDKTEFKVPKLGGTFKLKNPMRLSDTGMLTAKVHMYDRQGKCYWPVPGCLIKQRKKAYKSGVLEIKLCMDKNNTCFDMELSPGPALGDKALECCLSCLPCYW